jgi:hypothetical protein
MLGVGVMVLKAIRPSDEIEAPYCIPVGEATSCGGQDFQGDEVVQALVARLKDRSHPPSPNF